MRALALVVMLAAQSSAAVIFDNVQGNSTSLGISSSGLSEPIGAGTQLHIWITTTINEISGRLNLLPHDSQISFFIGDTTGAVLFTTAMSLAPRDIRAATWKTSPEFSFTLQAGNDYVIGDGNVIGAK